MNVTLPSPRLLFFAALVLLAADLTGCTHPQTQSPPVTRVDMHMPDANPAALPVSHTAGAPSTLKFTEVTETAGIHYQWKVQGTRPLNILQTIGNGCAFLDYDNDGNLDILLVGPKLALYKGDGHGHFTDVTHETGLDKLTGHFLGCAVGDYDNDGYDDIYITAYRGGVLLHNEAGKGFKDVTAAVGIQPQKWGTSAAFADVDGDGKLDLFICDYVQFDTKSQQLCKYDALYSACGPRFYKEERGVLYRNLGGKFQDVTKTWNVNAIQGKGLGVAIADYDGTGRQSIAIANDEQPGDLLQNKKGKFKQVAAEAGTAFDNEGGVHGGMGIDWGDYDNDGKLDLLVGTFQHETKNIYHNDGGGFFTDKAAALGFATEAAPFVTFGVKWLDADNDGFLDALLANGHVQDNITEIDKSTTYKQPLLLFHNVGGTAFEAVNSKAGDAFTKPIVGRGLAVGDFDNDGKMDALVVDSEGSPLLLHNETPNAGHWLLCKLVGIKSNRDGIGALITAEVGDKKLLRRCATDGSYMSASDRRVHVGLGAATKATLTVIWPSGHKDVYADVPADKVVTLTEGKSQPE